MSSTRTETELRDEELSGIKQNISQKFNEIDNQKGSITTACRGVKDSVNFTNVDDIITDVDTGLAAVDVGLEAVNTEIDAGISKLDTGLDAVEDGIELVSLLGFPGVAFTPAEVECIELEIGKEVCNPILELDELDDNYNLCITGVRDNRVDILNELVLNTTNIKNEFEAKRVTTEEAYNISNSIIEMEQTSETTEKIPLHHLNDGSEIHHNYSIESAVIENYIEFRNLVLNREQLQKLSELGYTVNNDNLIETFANNVDFQNVTIKLNYTRMTTQQLEQFLNAINMKLIQDGKSKRKMSDGIIAGIVIGVLLIIILLIVLDYKYKKILFKNIEV